MFVLKKDFYFNEQPDDAPMEMEIQCISHFSKETEAEKALNALLLGSYRGFLNIVEVKGDKCNFCRVYYPNL